MEIRFNRFGADVWLEQWDAFRDQVPYATALTLNDGAREAVKTLREELPQHFTVRSPWTARAIGANYIPVKGPGRFRTMEAKVGTYARYMDVHVLSEAGEGERARQSAFSRPEGKKPMGAIPTDAARELLGFVGGGNGQLSSWHSWPRQLIQQGKAYRVGDKVFSSKHRESADRGKLLFVLREDEKVKIKPRWPWASTVSGALNRTLNAQWPKRMAHAVRTAKRKR